MTYHIQKYGVGTLLCSIMIILNLVQIALGISKFKILRVRHLELVWVTSSRSMQMWCFIYYCTSTKFGLNRSKHWKVDNLARPPSWIYMARHIQKYGVGTLLCSITIILNLVKIALGISKFKFCVSAILNWLGYHQNKVCVYIICICYFDYTKFHLSRLDH